MLSNPFHSIPVHSSLFGSVLSQFYHTLLRVDNPKVSPTPFLIHSTLIRVGLAQLFMDAVYQKEIYKFMGAPQSPLLSAVRLAQIIAMLYRHKS